VNVAVTDLRAHLSDWLQQARDGNDVVITDRGVPVARLTPIAAVPLIEQLLQEKLLSRPLSESRPKAKDIKRAISRRPVSEIVIEQRK
jgi:prevent-host-death family protein